MPKSLSRRNASNGQIGRFPEGFGADQAARAFRPNGPAELPTDYKPPDREKWVRLPEKYADPDQSGLTTTLKSGTNPFDIPLK